MVFKTHILEKSKRKSSEYKITMDSGLSTEHVHHFGGKGAKTFVSSRTEKEKQNWINRHKKDKNYNQKHSGIYHARKLLWGPSKSLKKNIKIYEKEHNSKLINRT